MTKLQIIEISEINFILILSYSLISGNAKLINSLNLL